MSPRHITRKARSSPAQFHQELEIFHFTPPGLIAPEHTLAFNTNLGTLSLLGWQNDHPRLLIQEQFTSSEIAVLVPLLHTYPSYCPYEMVLASYETGRLTEEIVVHYRTRLNEALQQPDVWDMMMRLMRGVLSCARLKLHCFGLVVVLVSDTGYMLKGTSNLPVFAALETIPESISG